MTAGPAKNVVSRNELVGKTALSLSTLAIFLFLLTHSHFLDLFSAGDVVRSAILIIEIILILFGIALSLISGEIVVSAAAITMFASVPFYAYIFSTASGGDFVFSSGGDYLFLGAFSLVFLAIKGGRAEALLQSIYKMSVIYGAIYILVVLGLSAHVLSVNADSHMVLDSGGGVDRGLRVTLANSFIIFGTCVATIAASRTLKLISFVNLLIFCGCLYLSGSRYISLLLVVATIIYFIIRNSNITRNIFFTIFFVGLCFVIFVIASHNYNPFDGFVSEAASHGDVSAWARWKDIDIANKLIPEHWAFGIGIPNGLDAYKPVSGVAYFYPQDIGLVGVFVMFGVPGFLFYTFICFCACTSHKKLSLNNLSLKLGLGLAGAIMALFSHLAPIFAGNAVPFGVLYLAIFAWKPRRVLKIIPHSVELRNRPEFVGSSDS